MQVAESTLLEGKMIHLNEQTGAFEPETLNILGGAMDEAWRRVKLTHLNGSATLHAPYLLNTFSQWPDRASGTLSVSLKAR